MREARTKSGTVPRSSAMTSTPGSRSTFSTRSPSASCFSSSAGVKNGSPAVERPGVRPVETDEMVDAVPVVEIAGSPRPVTQPAEIVGRDRVPSIGRHAPVLTGCAERIRRCAYRHVEVELVLPGPDVGAVAVHHEREIAEQCHTVCRGRGARLSPLRVGQPLQVLVIQHVRRELLARSLESLHITAPERLGPFGPRPVLFPTMNRPKQGVVVEPPRLAGEERPQRAGAARVAAPFLFAEALEGHRERGVLQAPDRLIFHPGRTPRLVETCPVGRRQRHLAADPGKLRHCGDSDEDRIDGHRAHRRVRRCLTARHFVERQQLQHALAGAGEPRGDRRDITDVADAPTRGRRTGKQGDEDAGAAAAGRSAHACLPLDSRYRNMCDTPSRKRVSATSRLTTRCDSCAKSKK